MAGRKFGRTDIPYKDRLLLDKLTTIAQHRDHAAMVVLKIATWVLNRQEGLGYMRLCRFARETQKMIDLYYSDPEYQEVKLNQGLEQIGFLIKDGRLYSAVDGDGNTIPVKMLEGMPDGTQK